MTSATRLFQQGVSEQIVCEVTGNSSEAVRAYKRKSSDMQCDVSQILYGNQAKKTESATVSKPAETEKVAPEISVSKKENAQVLIIDTNSSHEQVISNVTYNAQKVGEKYIVNVYPVVNIAGNVPTGHPIIIYVNVNIPE